MKRTLLALGLLLAATASAHAMTFKEFGHALKEDAVAGGHKVARVGAETGHGVVHAGKTVAGDIRGGFKHDGTTGTRPAAQH